jgi:hypothetical protein
MTIEEHTVLAERLTKADAIKSRWEALKSERVRIGATYSFFIQERLVATNMGPMGGFGLTLPAAVDRAITLRETIRLELRQLYDEAIRVLEEEYAAL